MKRLPFLLLALILTSCRESSAPSSAQDRRLDEADAMLNEASNGLESIDDQGLGTNADVNAQ